MCGLVGVAGRLTFKDVKVFSELLYADKLRGVDSTGIGVINAAGEAKVFKGPFSPEQLLMFKNVDAALISTAKVLMGHNRAATRGKVTGPNAHPFFTGRILGAHNGTLDFHCLKDLEKNYEGDTDSEQIINTIHSLDGSLAKTAELMSGAWALSVYDIQTESISFLRNDQRPLYYALSESRETLYWASEAYMLRWILERNDIKILENKVHLITPDVIFSWAVPQTKEFIFQAKPDREAAPGKRVRNFYSGNGHHGGLWEQWEAERPDPNVQRGSAANSGGNGFAASGNKTRRTDVPVEWYDAKEDNDVIWEIYGFGWSEAERKDSKFNNPFCLAASETKDITVAQPSRAEAYREGFQDYFRHRDLKTKGETDEDDETALKRAEVNRRIEHISKETDKRSKVILVGELKSPAKSPVGQLVDEHKKVVQLSDHTKKQHGLKYRGPTGKEISAAKFKELTNHECGWCENGFDPNTDDGKFIEMAVTTMDGGVPKTKTEHVYACGECLADPVQHDFITEAEKAVKK